MHRRLQSSGKDIKICFKLIIYIFFSRKSDSGFKQYVATVSSKLSSSETSVGFSWENNALPHTHLVRSAIATCARGCLALENNGMSSWLRWRAWRAHGAGVGVSDAAPAVWTWPGPGWDGGKSADRRGVVNYLSGSSRSDVNAFDARQRFGGVRRDVMIKCATVSRGQFVFRRASQAGV